MIKTIKKIRNTSALVATFSWLVCFLSINIQAQDKQQLQGGFDPYKPVLVVPISDKQRITLKNEKVGRLGLIETDNP